MSNPADRNLDGDTGNVEATEAVDAERINRIIGIFCRGQQRQKATEIRRIEDRAQINIEGFGALTGENFDAGRRIRVYSLRRESLVIWHRRRSDIGRHGDQLLTREQFSPLISPDLGHCVGLTAAKSF